MPVLITMGARVGKKSWTPSWALRYGTRAAKPKRRVFLVIEYRVGGGGIVLVPSRCVALGLPGIIGGRIAVYGDCADGRRWMGLRTRVFRLSVVIAVAALSGITGHNIDRQAAGVDQSGIAGSVGRVSGAVENHAQGTIGALIVSECLPFHSDNVCPFHTSA